MEMNSLEIRANQESYIPPTDTINEQSDRLAPTYPTWSTRWKCCQSYLCVSLSVMSVFTFCDSLFIYGFAIFVPYVLLTITLGVPAVLVEILFGRYGSGNIVAAWRMCPPARGLFWCLFLVSVCSVTVRKMYSVFLLKYVTSSFSGQIQWSTCEKYWAGDNCYIIGKKQEAFTHCLTSHTREYCNSLDWQSSANLYWMNIIISTDDLEILYSILYLFFSHLLSLAIIFKGIHSFEKAHGLLIYPVFAFYGILATVSFSVPDALQGFIKLCNIGWSNLTSFDIWIAGFQDLFIFFGAGTLTLSFISCHGKFTDNILLDVFCVTFISIISTLIFTIPFLCAIAKIGDINNPRVSSEVIVFITEAFLLYPFPNALWMAMYMINAFLMSASSEAIALLSLSESLQFIFDTKKRMHCILIVTAGSFFCTVVTGALRIRIYIAPSTTITLNVLLTTLTWQLFYGIGNFKTDYHFMMGYPVPVLIKTTLNFLIPLPLVRVTRHIIKQIGLILQIYNYHSGISTGFQDYAVSLILVAIYIFSLFYQMIQTKRRKEKLTLTFTADPNWGPDNALLQKSRKIFYTSTVTREFTYRQQLNKKPFMKPPDFSEQNIVCVT